MALRRKVRKIGNSLALPVPNEIFEFLGFDPAAVKYRLCQDNTGGVFILILEKEVMALDEKKFQRRGNAYSVIIPKPLCNLWNIGLGENQSREIEISFDESPLKWRLKPV